MYLDHVGSPTIHSAKCVQSIVISSRRKAAWICAEVIDLLSVYPYIAMSVQIFAWSKSLTTLFASIWAGMIFVVTTMRESALAEDISWKAYLISHLRVKLFLHEGQEYCTTEWSTNVGKLFAQRVEKDHRLSCTTDGPNRLPVVVLPSDIRKVKGELWSLLEILELPVDLAGFSKVYYDLENKSWGVYTLQDYLTCD